MHSISPGNHLWETPVFEINGRHILVTGGSSGFGRHFARFLASNGAHVTLAARRAEALAAGVAEINRSGGKAQSVVFDVTVADKIDGGLKDAEAKFGPIHASSTMPVSRQPGRRSIRTSVPGTAWSIPI
jgi:nucleoside-diphosphate-sugar epimerase